MIREILLWSVRCVVMFKGCLLLSFLAGPGSAVRAGTSVAAEFAHMPGMSLRDPWAFLPFLLLAGLAVHFKFVGKKRHAVANTVGGSFLSAGSSFAIPLLLAQTDTAFHRDYSAATYRIILTVLLVSVAGHMLVIYLMRKFIFRPEG